MSLLKTFGENGEIIGSEDSPINETNFNLYVQQHGHERALGYQDALADILKAMDKDVLRNPHYSNAFNSKQAAGSRVFKFFRAQKSLLQMITDTLVKLPSTTTPNSDLKI